MTTTDPPAEQLIYIQLFHGRDDPDEDMDDFGYEGPVLGPFKHVQLTYMCDVKFSMRRAEFLSAFPDIAAQWKHKGYSNLADDWIDHHFTIANDLIAYEGKYYGDFSITAAPDTIPVPKRIIATFTPQAWAGGYAVEVDPQGPTEFDVTDIILALGKDRALALKDDDFDSDQLIHNAPDWIRNWTGPFYISVADSIAEFFAPSPLNTKDESP